MTRLAPRIPRSLRHLTAAAIVATAAVALPIATATPSYANAAIEATSVSLNADANCGDADLDLGFDSNTIETETGHATNLAGDVLDDFSQSSGLSDQTGYVGYGISVDPEQPDHTIVGTYASIGFDPPSAADTAEFFVLYRCSTDGAQTTLYTCFGDYGTCPQTAAEAAALVPATIAVTPTTPVAGGDITVTGTCVDAVAEVSLGTDADGQFATSGPFAPEVDHSFSVPFTLPTDVPDPFVAEVVCGDPASPLDVASVQVSLAGPATTTSSTPPATAPVGVETTASFTG